MTREEKLRKALGKRKPKAGEAECPIGSDTARLMLTKCFRSASSRANAGLKPKP